MFGKQAMQLTHDREFKMGSRKKLLVGELSNSKSKPLKVSASTHTVVAKQLFLDRLYVCVQRECQLTQHQHYHIIIIIITISTHSTTHCKDTVLFLFVGGE